MTFLPIKVSPAARRGADAGDGPEGGDD